MSVTVYSTPACFQCKATKRDLDKLGVEYTAIDVTEDAEAASDLKALGYTEAPVVIVRLNTGTEHWSGHRPDRLTQLAGDLAATAYLTQGQPPVEDVVDNVMSMVNPISGETGYDVLARKLTGDTNIPKPHDGPFAENGDPA